MARNFLICPFFRSPQFPARKSARISIRRASSRVRILILLVSLLVFLPVGCRCGKSRDAQGGAWSSASGDKILIVTTSSDFRDICRRVAGDFAEVESLARGDQDLHGIEVSPSHILMLKRATIYFSIGLGMDDWAHKFIRTSGNALIEPGAKNHFVVASFVDIIEKPAPGGPGRTSHLQGNPHYWLNPENAAKIAAAICQSLSALYPARRADFEKGREEFTRALDGAVKEWKRKMRPFAGRKIATYHKSWTYFTDFFGLIEAAIIEPQPGIPPSPAHISDLIDQLKREKIGVILCEPFYPVKVPRMVAEQAGAELLVLPTSVGGIQGADDYIGTMDRIVESVAAALRKGGK